MGIDVTFSNVDAADGIEANTPLLIKVSKDIETSVFESVTIEPEDEPVVQVGKKAAQRGYFHGTYVTQKVPEENLFISNNRFYYSTGNSTIKGYRGYFEFRDVLDAYYDVASVKFNLYIDGEATHIRESIMSEEENHTWYDLCGRKMIQPKQKGIYIIKGKKIAL